MDVPYDHIQEEILSGNDPSKKDASQGDAAKDQRPNVDLNTELQETFRDFSASPWGARIGGLWDNVRKQGETYYEGARQEYAAASEEAVKGFSDLRDSIVGHTRNLSLDTGLAAGEGTKKEKDEAPTPRAEDGEDQQETTEESTGTGEGFLTRFKAEAAKRLKEFEKAEDAADEALLRFGMNVRQKLRDAVSIIPPDTQESSDKVLFESKDAEGKRVIHATRFEAQLHVIHSNLDNFSHDPVSEQWPAFKEEFNVDAKTDAIAADLDTYPDLRAAMEKLVPEKVDYADFWCRYYFLRLVVETEERKRKELVKGTNVEEEEEVAWDDDSDSDSESPSTPQVKSNKPNIPPSTSTTAQNTAENTLLKPRESRRSNDQQSQPDSESSYDVVSGATSHTPASPKEKSPVKADESDEEDWE
ncbi:BSD domain protein [Aspergillus sp. HF37]|nr:BSD domain protein [Aspergillus sp. HF37]